MGDFIENMGLHTEGYNDDQITQIDAAKDDALHVVATIQEIWPRLTRLLPVIRMIAEVEAAHQKEEQS